MGITKLSPPPPTFSAAAAALLFTSILLLPIAAATNFSNLHREPPSPNKGLCAELIRPEGYPCVEYTVQTEDGYLLGLQRVSPPTGALFPGPPVFLQHGLFQGGDCWFANSNDQSLGFILADQGFDVWIGNVRGTHWSHGHITLSESDKEFWDWSWQELALYDLAEMINFVYSTTASKIFYVGHSQGTIMALAAFTRPDVVNMVEAAALLCPISYLNHISSQLVLSMVAMHLPQMLMDVGIHKLNFKSDFVVEIVESICDGGMDCGDLLASITGQNCCFNNSRVDFYLQYEPHPSSSKNLNHLFQMIRKGEFAMYDYGLLANLKHYGHFIPPTFDIASIPESLPIWMGYGGHDALADIADVTHTLKELKSTPELLYVDSYGHLDFVYSAKAKQDVYAEMIRFFGSRKLVKSSSY